MPPDQPLKEGTDYYLEDGRYVFTAVYLRRRGHCCQSGCRHCPYGYRKPHTQSPADTQADTDHDRTDL